MKNRVTAIVRCNGKNHGFSIVVDSSIKNINRALERAYGSDNIIVCTIKEV